MWPENEESILFFAGLGQGAWHYGMNGPTGLRDERIRCLFYLHGIRKKRRKEIYADLLVLESSALNKIHST